LVSVDSSFQESLIVLTNFLENQWLSDWCRHLLQELAFHQVKAFSREEMLPLTSREVEVTRVSLRLENGCDKDRVTQHELVIDRPGRLVGLKFKH
jgi:hypothetical protein